MSDSIKLEYTRYKLVGENTGVEVYFGKNELGQDSLLFLVPLLFPQNLLSNLTDTDLMSIHLVHREDGMTVLAFDLRDSNYKSIFLSFSENMISYICHNQNDGNVFDTIVLRYVQWQKLLRRNSRSILSVREVRGLIGELLFLKDYLIPMEGAAKALSYWTGPYGSDQDFRTPCMWYEVKTIAGIKNTVIVSSVDQLDTNQYGKGVLVVFSLDTTVLADINSITINKLVAEIKLKLTDQESCVLDDILFVRNGYYSRAEYDSGEYVVRKLACDMYCIDENSPVLRKRDIPASVVSVEYELSLAGLLEFKTDSEA